MVDALQTFPDTREESYDPDLVWDGTAWVSDADELMKNAHFHTQAISVSKGLIYYESLT